MIRTIYTPMKSCYYRLTVKYSYWAQDCPFCHMEGWHDVWTNYNITHPNKITTGKSVLIVFNPGADK